MFSTSYKSNRETTFFGLLYNLCNLGQIVITGFEENGRATSVHIHDEEVIPVATSCFLV